MTQLRNGPQDFEQMLAQPPGEATYLLRLYVSGLTPRSTEAIARLKTVCEEHLAGHYELEVIDIYQQPQRAKGEQIVATPTLIRKLPLPIRRLVGDLSNKERVLLGLDLREAPEREP
jgi:circadian clock protein KaiB